MDAALIVIVQETKFAVSMDARGTATLLSNFLLLNSYFS
jgi:hypothetical protein